MVPFDLNLIDFKMLTYPERKWLANYHNAILQNIRLHLDDFEEKWFIANFINNVNLQF